MSFVWVAHRVYDGSMTKLARIATAIILIVIAFVTLGPVGLRPQTGEPMLERAFAYFVLGAFAMLSFPERLFRVFVGVLAVAIGLELLQLVDPTRDGRVIDAVVKVAGGVLGVLLANAVSVMRRSARGSL